MSFCSFKVRSFLFVTGASVNKVEKLNFVQGNKYLFAVLKIN